MALFCAAFGRDSVYLLRFSFLSRVKIFSLEVSPVCRLKYLYICFSFDFCFLVIVVLLMLVLFLVVVISLSLLFLCRHRVIVLMHPRYLQCGRVFFLLFFDTYNLSMSSLGCKTL